MYLPNEYNSTTSLSTNLSEKKSISCYNTLHLKIAMILILKKTNMHEVTS